MIYWVDDILNGVQLRVEIKVCESCHVCLSPSSLHTTNPYILSTAYFSVEILSDVRSFVHSLVHNVD